MAYATLDEIKADVLAGNRVCWQNEGYVVVHDSIGQWLVKYEPNGHCAGLFWRDGLRSDYRPSDFFRSAR